MSHWHQTCKSATAATYPLSPDDISPLNSLTDSTVPTLVYYVSRRKYSADALTTPASASRCTWHAITIAFKIITAQTPQMNDVTISESRTRNYHYAKTGSSTGHLLVFNQRNFSDERLRQYRTTLAQRTGWTKHNKQPHLATSSTLSALPPVKLGSAPAIT